LALALVEQQEQIIGDIRAWDPSTLGDMYTLAKTVLLGDLDAAAKLAEQIVASGSTTRGALLAQPIFAPLLERSTSRP
jgi:hypothetical protein